MDPKDSLIGCILGVAAGDAMGLVCEGLSRQRQRRMFGEIDRYHFLFSRGMTSDDTEHTCMVAQALIASGQEPAAFITGLAWRFRFWLLGLPAGIGSATLRSILKLWIGFSGRSSGVRSAGNGPAMRSAIIGVATGSDPIKMRELVRAGTRITHTDLRAEFGAMAVALAAHLAASHEGEIAPADFLSALIERLPGAGADEFINLMRGTTMAAAAGKSPEAFADELGLTRGVDGFMDHTAPVCILAWLRNQRDFRGAVLEVIRCGGDTDTTAAIVGGIVGAGVGRQGIPEAWLKDLAEWPRSVAWMEKLGERLADSVQRGEALPALPLFIPGLFLRNLFFLLVVLAHGFRRLLPPY